MKRQEVPAVEEAVEHVRDHGDVIDQDRHAKGRLSSGAALVTCTALGVPAGLYEPGSIEPLLPYMAYMPAGALATWKYNRIRTKHRVGRAQEMQQVIEDELSESVDLIRFGKGKQKDLLLRWYGFDDMGETEQPYDFVERSRDVIAFARKHGIDAIAAHVPKDKVGQANLAHGSTLLTDAKKLKYARIWDHDAAGKVVAETVDNFEKLVNAYEGEAKDSIVTAIVKQLGSADIAKKFEVFTNSGHHPITRSTLITAVKAAIEMTGSDSHAIADKQPDGTVIRKKAHASVVVGTRGRSVHFDATHDNDTGHSSLQVARIGQLAGAVGARDNDTFLRDLMKHGLTGRSKLELLTGLHLLLERPTKEQLATIAKIPTGAADTAVEPLFVRYYDVDESISHQDLRGLRRGGLMTLQKVAAFALGFGLGIGIAHVGNEAWSREDAKYEAYSKKHNPDDFVYAGDERYDEFVDGHGSTSALLDRLLWKGQNELYEVNGAVSNAIAGVLVERLGLGNLYAYLPDYAYEQASQWRERIHVDAPASVYAQGSDQSYLADVPGDSNKVVYTAESLTGESTEGYWHDNLYSDIMINDGGSPFVDGGVELYVKYNAGEEVVLPHDPENIAPLEADFMVETPYINAGEEYHSYLNEVSMPVKEGTDVVAAQIVDQNNPDNFVAPTVKLDSSGVYTYVPSGKMDDRIFAADMERPVLRYWLKSAKRDELQHEAKWQPVFGVFANRAGRNPSQADITQIANETKQALGLAADASAQEVIAALADGKQYSYTPFARAGVEDINLHGKKNPEVLRSVARVLAELETMNCNVAQMTALIATLDERSYLGVSGFHEDGDGLLAQQEAHAWLMDREGEFVDPTPRELAPGEERRTEVDTEQPEGQEQGWLTTERGAAALLTGVFTYLAWRRRAMIAEKTDAARTHLSLGSLPMKATAEAVKHDLYAPAGRTFWFRPDEAPSTVAETATKYSFSVPSGKSVKVLKGGAAEVMRRAMLRLNDAAIRRHAERTDDSAEV